MIIDCHGHYTTEPKDLHRFRKEQTAAANAKDKTAMPLPDLGAARWWLHPLMLTARAAVTVILVTRLPALTPRPGRTRSARLPDGWLVMAGVNHGVVSWWRPWAADGTRDSAVVRSCSSALLLGLRHVRW